MPWKKGESGSIEGKPKGARNKLTESFLNALQSSFNQNGRQVIEDLSQKEVGGYLTLIAKVFPKVIRMKSVIGVMLESMTDEEIDSELERLNTAAGWVRK